jgi:hypothetical protein
VHHIGPCTDDAVGRALEQLAEMGDAAFKLWDEKA